MSVMPYLTKSNALKIVNAVDYKTTGKLPGDLYSKPIFNLSDIEKNKLLGLKNFLENSENFFTEYYVPIKAEDSYQYVFEGAQPAYHFRLDCDRLHSDYINFKVPNELRNAGKERVI